MDNHAISPHSPGPAAPSATLVKGKQPLLSLHMPTSARTSGPSATPSDEHQARWTCLTKTLHDPLAAVRDARTHVPMCPRCLRHVAVRAYAFPLGPSTR